MMEDDPAMEASAAAMFESAHARIGTASDSPKWTWAMATPDVKDYYRKLAYIGGAAAYEAEAALLQEKRSRSPDGMLGVAEDTRQYWLRTRAVALRGHK